MHMLNTLSRDAAAAFFDIAKRVTPKAQFRVGFYKHYGEFRDMLCSFDVKTKHDTAVYAGMVTVLDVNSNEPRSFKIERLAFIAIDDKVWLIENEKGEVPRVHHRHLEIAS